MKRMKITRTSPAEKRSNLTHVCDRARMFGRTSSPHWSWNSVAAAFDNARMKQGAGVKFTPKPCNPDALKNVSVMRVKGSQGSKIAAVDSFLTGTHTRELVDLSQRVRFED